MDNVNIVFARVDNRLVHGQVGMVWANMIGTNLIIVVDDYAAKDEMQQTLMKMTIATTGIGIRFWTVEHTIKNISKASPSQKIFIVTKTPKEMLSLVEAGIPIKEVNLGHMHSAEGKRKFLGNFIYVDDQDEKNLFKIKDYGVTVYAQISPDDKKTTLN